MKKWLALLLVLVLFPTYSLASLVSSRDSNGNFCSLYTGEYGTQYDVSPETFPYTFPYAGKELSVPFFRFYQAKIGYGYHPFVHIRLDVKQLSDEEIYWLREEDVHFNAFLKSNGSDELIYLSTLFNLLWTDEKIIDVVYYDRSASRSAFDGVDCLASIDIDHKDGITISFNSEETVVDSTYIHLTKMDAVPDSMHTMEAGLWEYFKNKLSEKGLSI